MAGVSVAGRRGTLRGRQRSRAQVEGPSGLRLRLRWRTYKPRNAGSCRKPRSRERGGRTRPCTYFDFGLPASRGCENTFLLFSATQCAALISQQVLLALIVPVLYATRADGSGAQRSPHPDGTRTRVLSSVPLETRTPRTCLECGGSSTDPGELPYLRRPDVFRPRRL